MSVRQLYRLILVPAVWTAYVVAIAVAEFDGGMSVDVLLAVTALGVPVLLALLAGALRWKPSPRPVQWPVAPAAPAWVPPVQVRRVEPVRPTWGSDNAVTRFMDPVLPESAQPQPVARAVAVAEPAAEPEFSTEAFRAWADGKREGIAEGRAQALEDLGLASEDEPGE